MKQKKQKKGSNSKKKLEIESSSFEEDEDYDDGSLENGTSYSEDLDEISVSLAKTFQWKRVKTKEIKPKNEDNYTSQNLLMKRYLIKS